MSLVYLNGEYLPISEARVSVLDRGFTFGDGIYEVLPVYSGRIFRLAEHLQRLNNNLSAIYMDNPHSIDEWEELFKTLLVKNQIDNDYSIYVQISRGVGERNHTYDKGLTPTVFAMCKPMVSRDLVKGIRAVTHDDIRWQLCNIKATALLASVLLKRHALDKDGSQEAILLRNGKVTEGAASNVFIVLDGKVRTPAKDSHILPGITRDLVVELLQDTDFGCDESDISEKELLGAGEIWISSSTMGIVPVTILDGKKVGDGVPGEVWKIAAKMYQNFLIKQTGEQLN